MNTETKKSDWILAIGFVAILAVMIVPLPKFAIDLFICLELAISVLMLFTSLYVSRALDFSVFPSLLLMTTLFRLSLNIATTRVILLKGATEGTAAGGEVIRSFGEFVIGGNYAVGIVVFIILVIINFVVITKGAGRVAEVAARFTLDAMPGKQMAIDADLNAGLINEEEARKRRTEIAKEADFYGAMDGSSKFVRGDAIAGILIVFVNIIGGIVIGTIQQGMDFMTASSTFVLLTIGDGLVTQIPALIISTAAGIIVTRTGTSANFSTEVSRQLSMKPTAILGAAIVMAILGLIPGLPFWPFFILAASIGGAGWLLIYKNKKELGLKMKVSQEEKLKSSSEKLENLLAVDILELEVGYGLINIVDAEQSGDLLDRVSNIRKQFVLDLGIIIPPLRIRDNLELAPGDYQILLKGVVIGQGSLMVGNLLAMDPGGSLEPIPGTATKEPVFGLDALWISARQKEDAVYKGYTVVDLSTIIATHLTEIIRQNIADLLGRQELQSLLDTLKQTAPKVVEDLVPNLLPMSSLLKILKSLLKENVPIRDLRTILESLSDVVYFQKDPVILTEHVRSCLSRVITKRIVGNMPELSLITLDKEIEETLANSILQTDQGAVFSADPEFVKKFIESLNQMVGEMMATLNQAILLCSPIVRPHLKGLIDRFIPNVTVLSHNEIASHIKVQSFATMRFTHGS